MGCWNATCGLTHLPIFHGDDIVVVLRQGEHYESRYYPIPLLCTPIYGKYDDYGGIEEVDEESLKIASEVLSVHQNLTRVERKSDDDAGLLAARRPLTVDLITEYNEGRFHSHIEDGGYEVPQWVLTGYSSTFKKSANLGVKYIYVHRKAWDAFLEASGAIEEYVRKDGFTTDLAKSIPPSEHGGHYTSRRNLYAHILSHVHNLDDLELMKRFFPTALEFAEERNKDERDVIEILDRIKTDEFINAGLPAFGVNRMIGNIDRMKLMKLLTRKEVSDKMLDLNLAMTGLMDARMQLSSEPGQGSQDDDRTVSCAIFRAGLEIDAARTAKEKEWNGEE